MKHKPTLLLFTLAFGWSLASAQVQIDKRRPAHAQSEVYVENAFGAVEIVGWDKDEVAVTGTLAAGAEGLSFESEDAEVYVEVDVPDRWFYESDDDAEYRSDLTVHVPRGSSVGVETTNATVRIENVEGIVNVETVNGTIEVRGNPRGVEIESMTGDVDVRAQAAEMDVETVSGAVTLTGVRAGVCVSTVSGAIDIQGDQLEEVSVETTAGDVRLDAGFVEEGEVDIETFSGRVELVLSTDVKAHFECETFSGQIQNELGPTPRRRGTFTPYQELKFSTGLNEFDVSVETYSGDILLLVRGQ